MRKYIQLLSMFITRYLTYRARVFIHFISDSAQYLLFPFIWIAIFANSTPPGGYTIPSLVTYYIIMTIVSAGFLAHPSKHVRNEIHDGTVNRFLTMPLPFFNKQVMAELSYKCISSLIASVILILFYIFARDFVVLPSTWWQWLFFVISLSFTFSISFLIEYLIGLTSLWIGDIHALQTWEEIVNAIFAGRLAPLAFLPLYLQTIADYLPYKYIAFVPAQVFLGQITLSEIPQIFGVGLAWILGLGFLVYILWRQGLKRYDGSSI